MEKENTYNKIQRLKKHKIINITSIQDTFLKKFNDHSIYSYNIGIDYINDVNPYDDQKQLSYDNTEYINLYLNENEYINDSCKEIKNMFYDVNNNLLIKPKYKYKYNQLAKEYKKRLYDIMIYICDTYTNINQVKLKKTQYELLHLLFRYHIKLFFNKLDDSDSTPILSSCFYDFLINNEYHNKVQQIINNINPYDNMNVLKFEYIDWYQDTKIDYIFRYSKEDLRNVITPKYINTKNNTQWILETPKAIREAAVFEAYTMNDIAIKNYKNNHTKKPIMKKRNNKTKWSINIPPESITITETVDIITNNKKQLYQIQLYKYSGKLSEPFEFGTFQVKEKIEYDKSTNHPKQECKIIYDGINYYLGIPEKRNIKHVDTIKNRYFMVAADPGIRKFNTMFIPERNEYIEIGTDASDKIWKKLIQLDNLISYQSKNCINNKKRRRLILKIKKVRKKIMYLQDELHKKTSSWLCNNFKIITIPKLNEANSLIKKKDRKLKTVTVRKMVTLAHNKFILTLQMKAEEFNSVIEIVPEKYTSQKCSNCKKHTKTAKELYKCNHCGYEIDRDVQASKNRAISSILETVWDMKFEHFKNPM